MAELSQAPAVEAAAGRLLQGLRAALGVVLGGIGGVIAFMVIVHQAEKRDHAGNIDLPRAVGQVVHPENDAARYGLLTIFVAGVVIAIVVLPVAMRLLRGRSWWLIGAIAGLGALLVWGLIFAPIAGDELEGYTAGGVFGSDGSASVLITYLLASAAFGAVAARIATVIAAADFWVPKDNDIRKGLDQLHEMGLVGAEGLAAPRADSLELPEQGAQQRGQAAGREPR